MENHKVCASNVCNTYFVVCWKICILHKNELLWLQVMNK
jgi:hypothetical protein